MKTSVVAAATLLLVACKHPLAIEGRGDIVELLKGERGCTLAQFESQSPSCTENAVSDENYTVSYQAVPRSGWQFSRWRGTRCGS